MYIDDQAAAAPDLAPTRGQQFHDWGAKVKMYLN